MIEVYGSSTPNVVKVIFMLEEIGLPYKVNRMNVFSGALKQPEFMALNPNAKVPVIVDSEGPEGGPFTVFESGAILLYLAEKTGKLQPRNAAERSRVMQWLMFQMAGVGPMFGQAIHFTRFKPDDQYSVSRYITEARRLHDVLERRLGESEYLAGPEFSLADIATFPWMTPRDRMYCEAVFNTSPSEYPNIVRWMGVVRARPAYLRLQDLRSSLVRENVVNAEKATPDEMDRFVGRGRYARA